MVITEGGSSCEKGIKATLKFHNLGRTIFHRAYRAAVKDSAAGHESLKIGAPPGNHQGASVVKARGHKDI